MNQVQLAGEVAEQPFRPGGGSRVVVKLKIRRFGGSGWDRFEFDAFGPTGDVAMGVERGEWIAISGRLEDREYTENGQLVNELRVVANFVETTRPPTIRPADSAANPSRPSADAR